MADVALVCGASGALGAAVVRAFAARGDHVVAAARDGMELDPGLGETVRAEVVDLAVPDAVEALWDRLDSGGNRPRWLVNAAGGFRGGSVADTEPEQYRFVHDLNLATTWWSCRAAARRMDAGGAIVNVSSRSAVSGGAKAAGYAVAKAGIVRLTEVLAEELAGRSVRVNALLPSVMDTAANRASMSPAALRAAVPTEQVAAVATFLCSDAARAVTGAVIPVYGLG